MKKYVYLSLFTMLPLFTLAQKTYVKDGKLNGLLPVDERGLVTYQSVNTVDGVSKDELFKRARKWFSKTYTSPKDVLQIVDPNTGEISGRGVFLFTESVLGVSHTYPVSHTLSIEIKDGRYRVTLTKFSVDDPRSPFAIEHIPYASKKFLDRFYEKIDSNAKALLESFHKSNITSDDF